MLAAVKQSKSIKSNNDNSRNPTRQPHVNEGMIIQLTHFLLRSLGLKKKKVMNIMQIENSIISTPNNQKLSSTNIKYPTRSKSREAYAAQFDKDWEPTPFFNLKDDGKKKDLPMWKQYKFILCNNLGELVLDKQGKQITYIRILPEDLIFAYF